MITFEDYYRNCSETYSDIYQHIPTLKRYSEMCDRVTEMGVRAVVSTFALIAPKPKRMVSIDFKHPKNYGGEEKLQFVIDWAKENGIDYSFLMGDSTKVLIEPTDLLFIDTLHTYEQLTAELSLHPSKVKKFMIFHDTVTFCNQDEIYNPHQKKTGLCPAIDEFLISNPDWRIVERYDNNNGLTVLGRI
jgi:hypothetical protein